MTKPPFPPRRLTWKPQTLVGAMLADVIEILHEIGFEGEPLRRMVAEYAVKCQAVEKSGPKPEVVRLSGLALSFESEPKPESVRLWGHSQTFDSPAPDVSEGIGDGHRHGPEAEVK